MDQNNSHPSFIIHTEPNHNHRLNGITDDVSTQKIISMSTNQKIGIVSLSK